MGRFDSFKPRELQLVYRVLQGQLLDQPGLLDSEFMDALQEHLHALARADGVDISDHGRWERWLGGEGVDRPQARPVLRLVRPDEAPDEG